MTDCTSATPRRSDANTRTEPAAWPCAPESKVGAGSYSTSNDVTGAPPSFSGPTHSTSSSVGETTSARTSAGGSGFWVCGVRPTGDVVR